MTIPPPGDRQTMAQRILGWLRKGYPEGIPTQDYVALLGLLQRQLTPAELDRVVAAMADNRLYNEDTTPITVDQVRAAIQQHVLESPLPEDVARVSARLAAGGWPLAPLH